MFCMKCGAVAADQTKFCPQCGAPLTESTQAAPVGSSPAPPPVPVYPGQPGSVEPPTDTKAVVSLVRGILSLTFFSIIAGIPAIILGHSSRAAIRRSMGRLKGDGLALAGLIMGYISLAAIPVIVLIIAAIAIPNLLKVRVAVNEAAARATMHTLNTDEAIYSNQYVTPGFAPNLATLGPGPSGSCNGEGSAANACLLDNVLGNAACTGATWCTKDHYKYNIQCIAKAPTCADYVISAIPIDSTAGRRNFCSVSDGVLRSESARSRRSAPFTVETCQALEAFNPNILYPD